MTKQTFVVRLLDFFPEFQEVYEENKSYHDIGAHLIFGDFRRFTEKAIEENNDDLVKRVCSFVNLCFKDSDNYILNALFVSYFEHFSEKDFKKLSRTLSAELVKEVSVFRKDWDSF